MRNAKSLASVAVLALLAVVSACSDRRPERASPTGPRPVAKSQLQYVMGTCTTIEELNTLAAAVFGAGSPNVNSVLGKLDNLAKKVAADDSTGAQAQAWNIVTFVRDKAAEGTLPGTQADITAFISGVLCYAGLSPDTFLILPTDSPQVRTASDGLSGISLEANTVAVPTLLSITTLDPAEGSPLDTKLDQYATYTEITASDSLTKPAVVAVCPTAAVPPEVRARLRLGHQAATGFEVTPAADGTFLTCSDSVGLASARIGGWLRNVASIFLPKPLYARVLTRRDFGGVGGSVTELSPFGAVDPELSFSGGVGGSVTELHRRPLPTDATLTPKEPVKKPGAATTSSAPAGPLSAAPRGTANLVSAGTCSEVAATVGTPLEPECRPFVRLKTHAGTILTGVPVNWAVTSGDGAIAPETLATQACGPFGSTAATATDTAGKAGVCWTLGPNGGPNTSRAVPTAGGDAPAGVTFNPPAIDFTAEGLKITPTATATGGSFVFDNLPHPGSGTCSDGLTPELSYSGDSVPTNVGTYTLTVTCGAGSTVYNMVTATDTISIGVAVPVVTVTCPTDPQTYTGAAQTPCTASVTAPGLSLTPIPTYTNNVDAGTATAAVSVAASGNYASASGSATFTIAKAPTTTTLTCTPSVVFDGSPQTPCTASLSGAGTPAGAPTLSYTNNTNAGTASVTATYAGGDNWLGSTASTSFAITKAPSVTTVTCPTSATYTGSALTPCDASVTGVAGLTESLTVGYTGNVNVGTATASAAYAGGTNWEPSDASVLFTINAAATSVAVACPASVSYNGAVQTPCSATASGPDFNGTTIGVTYNPLSPKNAGAYVADASFAAGGNYLGSANSASFAILQLAANATASSATINFGAAVPTIACTVTGLLGVDAGTVTCTTSVPGVTIAGTYPTTPVVSPASPVNYAVTPVNGTLTVAAYVQVGCFSSPVYSVMPETKSAQRKGSNIPIKCTLTTPQGVPVTTATGDIQVVDAGTVPANPPVKTGTVVFSATNVFKPSKSGNYAYGLDTSPAEFLVGHYYYVIATWNDGSKSEGWFLLR